jgi:hypothetical protein
MQQPIQQYVNEKTGKRYYYTTQPIICQGCEKQLIDFVVIYVCWDKNKSFIRELCFKCSEKYRQSTQAQEKIIMNIVNKKPLGAKLVLITRLELKNSVRDDSLFCNTLDAPYINNNAKRSFHPDYTFLDDSAPVKIGLDVDVVDDVNKNRLIGSVDELDVLFDVFKNEKNLIGNDEDDKKLIE